MNWTELNRSLTELLDHEHALAQHLAEALAGETEALQALDPAALDQATETKQHFVEQLAAVDGQRRQLCSGLGLTPDRDGMQALIARADGDSGQLMQRWERLLAQLESCREANQRNGTVVAAKRRRIDDALGLLRGAAPGTELYDANGEVGTSEFSHVYDEI